MFAQAGIVAKTRDANQSTSDYQEQRDE